MTSRRQFLGIGLLATAWPRFGLAREWRGARRVVSVPPASWRLYKAIFAAAHAPARRFAIEMQRRGVPVHAIDADITSLWFNDLVLRWRVEPAAIAGLTGPSTLFCLEQLAWDHRMRVVWHAPVPNTQGDASELVSWVISPVPRKPAHGVAA